MGSPSPFQWSGMLIAGIPAMLHTAVNGTKLETGVNTPLLDGDEICLGAVKLTFAQKG